LQRSEPVFLGSSGGAIEGMKDYEIKKKRSQKSEEPK
jgi:hypothetical protein